ncbi:MAG: DUF2007 domain-containing protein [Culturomica sp.]|jgi:hypothetical protein|nr:DUF2007 domain-containing protein [Culturomica sp.]
MENWTSVFNTETLYQAEWVKSLLEDHGIHAVVLNQKDSSYTTFGEIHVMVSPPDLPEAQKIVNAAEFE